LDAFAVDEVIHQYHRAARELWKFCWLGGRGAGVEFTARALRDMADQGRSSAVGGHTGPIRPVFLGL
ncbi:MAG TPA: hypothetical protein VFE45_14285, partial [Coriobacteriia bacterium]|nr:hypothetical protein [Coriobacteriia bacterium]